MKKDKNIHILKLKDTISLVNLQVLTCFDYVSIKNDLHIMQGLVDGLIEPVSICSFEHNNKHYSIDLVCNEEGKLLNMEFKGVIYFDFENDVYEVIAGKYFLALCDESTGEFVDMPKECVDAIDRVFTCAGFEDGTIVPMFNCDLLNNQFRSHQFSFT